MTLPARIVAAISACIVLVTAEHAREIHHLPSPDNARPGHRLGHFVGANGRACVSSPGALGTQLGIWT